MPTTDAASLTNLVRAEIADALFRMRNLVVYTDEVTPRDQAIIVDELRAVLAKLPEPPRPPAP